MTILASGVVLAFAGVAHAQSTQDLEYRELRLKDKQTEKVQASGRFETQGFAFDNLDFNALDASSDQAVLDTDDRGAFVFTGAGMDLSIKADDKTRFVAAFSHRGLWGDDNLGRISPTGSLLYVTNLYVEHKLAKGVKVRAGREFYQIGGLGGAADFVMADVLDQARIIIALGDVGHLDLVPISVVGSGGRTDRANFAGFVGGGSAEVEDKFNFEGDRMVRRHGGVLVLDGIAELDLRAYGFYTDIGARGSGANITYEGLHGNFADNDWVANFGARASYALGTATPYATFDLSQGIDRKELVARDVDNNGWAASLGVRVRPEKAGDPGLTADVVAWQASGAAYAEDGLQTSHGYTSMKGQQVGGMLANRFLGWHPSAYTGGYGVADTPHTIDRRSGTRFVQAAAGWRLGNGTWARASWWTFQDTGSTQLNLKEIDNIDPAFGYSRREFAAQERLGKALGHEANVEVGHKLSKSLRAWAAGGVLLPGDYYKVDVARVAGGYEGAKTALGGQDMAWAASLGTRLDF